MLHGAITRRYFVLGGAADRWPPPGERAGVLWDHINHSAVFLYGAVLAAAGCIALLILFL